MRILESWNGDRWIVGDIAFEALADAKAYRALVRTVRRTRDPVRLINLVAKIQSLRERALETIG